MPRSRRTASPTPRAASWWATTSTCTRARASTATPPARPPARVRHRRRLAGARRRGRLYFPTAAAALLHRDVETFFHEFGHDAPAVRKAELEMFAGTRVERDFVEAPSQMLENWCCSRRRCADARTTRRASRSPTRRWRRCSPAQRQLGDLNAQIVLASFDQAIHTAPPPTPPPSSTASPPSYCRSHRRPGLTWRRAGHLAGGYDPYYGYMWSEVFSADMFASRFEAEGIFNGDLCGASYRKEISPGGSRDAMDRSSPSSVASRSRSPSSSRRAGVRGGGARVCTCCGAM